MHTKGKRHVVGGSRREIQRSENEERKDCQNVSQVNSIPAPGANIREQLAALKAQVSHSFIHSSQKALKSNESHLNTKKKVLTVKKLIKVVNDKASPRKSQPEGNKLNFRVA